MRPPATVRRDARSAPRASAARDSARRRGRRRGRCRSAARRGVRRRGRPSSSSSSRAARKLECRRLRGSEQLLLRVSHSPPRALRASSANGDGGSAAPRSLSARRRRARARARARRHRDVYEPPHEATCPSRGSALEQLLGRQRARRGSARPPASGTPRSAPTGARPRTRTRPRARAAASSVTTCTPRGRALVRLVALAQPELGHRSDRARELARRRLRRSAHEGRGELAEARERAAAAATTSALGREQLLAPQPETVDQPVHVQVRPGRVERRDRRTVQLQEAQDRARAPPAAPAATRSPRPARRPCRDLPAASDLRAARDVDRAQLDRRAGQRSDGGAGVGGIGEQAQPREHVADLGALEERRLRRRPGAARRAPRARPRSPGPRGRSSARARRLPRAAPPRGRSGARRRPPPTAPARARWRTARTQPRRRSNGWLGQSRRSPPGGAQHPIGASHRL